MNQPNPETGDALEESADLGGNDDNSIDEEVGELLELIKGTAEHITRVIDRDLEASTKSFAQIDHLLDQAEESQRRVEAWLNRRS